MDAAGRHAGRHAGFQGEDYSPYDEGAESAADEIADAIEGADARPTTQDPPRTRRDGITTTED